LISDGDWAQLGKGTQAGVRIAGFQDLINRCTQAVEGETFGVLGFESPKKPNWGRRKKSKAGQAI